jgi:hypothetical protein
MLAQVYIRNSFFNGQTNISNAFANNTTASLGGIIGLLLPNIIIVAGVFFLFLIVYGGFTLIAFGGQDIPSARFQKYRNAITYGTLGLLLVISAYFILQILFTVTGINFTNPNL